MSATVAAQELGLCRPSIKRCCDGKQSSTGGWTFAEQEQPDLEGEEWRPFKVIQVSSCGRMQTPTSGKYFPHARASGYCNVQVGGQKMQFHRIICQVFHDKPPPGFHADHVENDRTNNRADSLQWLSPAENQTKRRSVSKLCTRRAMTTSMGARYESAAHACEVTGLSQVYIHQLCFSGKPHRVHGVFSYVETEPIAGEIFRNVTESHLAELRRQTCLPHVTM